MIWYRHPELKFRYLTDSIIVEYNNDTVAYIVYTQQSKVRDIFVSPDFRRQGLARYLLGLVERRTGRVPTAMPPISELGQFLFKP